MRFERMPVFGRADCLGAGSRTAGGQNRWLDLPERQPESGYSPIIEATRITNVEPMS